MIKNDYKCKDADGIWTGKDAWTYIKWYEIPRDYWLAIRERACGKVTDDILSDVANFALAYNKPLQWQIKKSIVDETWSFDTLRYVLKNFGYVLDEKQYSINDNSFYEIRCPLCDGKKNIYENTENAVTDFTKHIDRIGDYSEREVHVPTIGCASCCKGGNIWNVLTEAEDQPEGNIIDRLYNLLILDIK
jgi:hypothetical protein